jgi:hypothetical protein
MSTVNNGPQIVKNGLVLDLDASSVTSYSAIAVYKVECYSTYNGGLRSANYTVQYSDDNSTWTTAFTGVMSNNSSCGIITGTNRNDSNYTKHRYWRYVEGAAVVGHHPRVSRIDFVTKSGAVYNLTTYTTDNCSDSGTYIVSTVSKDFGTTTWKDISGLNNSFALNGDPVYSNNFFTLNGSTQFFYLVSAPSGFFVSSTNNFYADVGYAWTISAWFKFPVSPTTTRNSANNGGNCSYCIVGNGGGIGGAETLALFVSGGDNTTSAGALSPYYCVVGIRGSKTQLSLGSVNTNTWNNAIVTWDGYAGRGYFNGVDKGALNIGTAGMQVNGYTIGTQVGGNQGSHTYEGNISLTHVYNRALTSTEASQNYEATKTRFGL